MTTGNVIRKWSIVVESAAAPITTLWVAILSRWCGMGDLETPEEDSNQHRRVEVGQIKMPKTASIQTRLDIIHKLEIEEQPLSV